MRKVAVNYQWKIALRAQQRKLVPRVLWRSILPWGTPVRNDFTREKNCADHPPVRLNCCAESFSNNGDDFGLASDEVPQGYLEFFLPFLLNTAIVQE